MKQLIIKILLLLLPSGLLSQELSGIREKTIIAIDGTVQLDSLKIVPGSIELMYRNTVKIADSLYHAEPLGSAITFFDGFPYTGEQIDVSYRVFTSDPSLGMSRKDTTLIVPYQREEEAGDRLRYKYREVSDGIWSEEGLSRSGSISRGISFGNNQDVIVNSNLNLQLSGKLDDNINVLASISDQNIPLQPDGYSQQIQDFDRIFIQLFNDKLKLTAGDFGVEGGGGVFLPVDKKAQGIQFSSLHEPGNGRITGINNTASAAVAKGRYHRNSFTGSEGNQGPYKLKGANNELFIIVLAGTEKIYVDGRLLSRGVDRDYTIDYNLAEITFTSNMPITKDRRIIAEFEYSDRNYARFMLANTSEFTTAGGNYFINIFSEHDARNQPFMQELKEEEKALLSSLGDSLHLAWVPKADSVEFRDDIVLYEKSDTIADGQTYTIYIYSVDPDKAHYRPGFSYVGENNGNYKRVNNAANGRVFSWTAPVNGIPSGSHEPVTRLVAPKKHQVASMGGTSFLSASTEASFEIALSNNDKNTFSSLDNADNTGMAVRIGIDNKTPLGGEDNSLAGGIDYEFSGTNFATAERYRPVEYERNWNLENITVPSQEHKFSWHAGYQSATENFAGYKGEYLKITDHYSGMRNMLEAAVSAAGFNSRFIASYLNSGSEYTETGFLRHFAELSRPLWFFRLGARLEGEHNKIEEKSLDTLSYSSFSFLQKEIFIENPDTSKFHFFTAWRERDDKLPIKSRLEPSSTAREFSSGVQIRTISGNEIAGTLHHRKLDLLAASENDSDPENSLNGRLDGKIRILNGILQSTGFYETGSGMEAKRDFMFIEVPRGQGTHTWSDYNENGIKELDEFEPAIFPDQANYFRVFIPSDDFIRTRSNQFSQNIRVNPPPGWSSSSGMKRLISLFSGQTAFRTGQKIKEASLIKGINPFYSDLSDTNLINISSSFRNTISFRSPDRRISLEYLHRDNKSRDLLMNGFDTRHNQSNAITGRFDITQTLILSTQLEKGNKLYQSGFFPARDYDIDMLSGKLTVSYQPGSPLQTSLHVSWTSRDNNPGQEKSVQHNLGTELNYTMASKGNIILRADYFIIDFNAPVNTPVAWEMLEGLRPGNNLTLLVQLQRSLTGNLQLNLNYNGRMVSGERFAHHGGMQVRAFF